MKTIMGIYTDYGIPENLQLHMLRVTACAKLIVDNWKGKELMTDKLYRVLLLHDMGNIVKINPTEVQDKVFIANRERYVSLFGIDDHKVSQAIGYELGLDELELEWMNSKIFINNDNIINLDNYEIKIGAYCDQRVAPDGVMPLLERLNEAKDRYKDKPGSSMNNPKTDYLIHCAVLIETEIMQITSIKSDEINDISIQKNMDFFRGYVI